MAASLGWVAVRSRAPENLLASVHLSPTGTHQETPTAALCGMSLSTGWYVILVNDLDSLALADVARALSTEHEVVAVRVDSANQATAAGFRGGSRTWSVVHDAKAGGLMHLDAKGTLPISFSGIRAWHEHDQRAKGGADADVDCMIEIPLELAKRLVGFRHDEELSGFKRPHWDVLSVAEPAPAPVPVPVPAPVPAPVPVPVPVPVPEADPDPVLPPPKPVAIPPRDEEPEERKRRKKKRRPRGPLKRKERRRPTGLLGILDAVIEAFADNDSEQADARRAGLLAASRARRRRRRAEREMRRQEP